MEQIDITTERNDKTQKDDKFLVLMKDDGDTKEDIKLPEGDVGKKIEELFAEKETSKSLV